MAVSASQNRNGGPPEHLDGHATGALTDSRQEQVRGLATILMDMITPFGEVVAPHVHEILAELPTDRDMVESTRIAAIANARELISTLRAGMPPTAHETPSEALEHARFLKSRGVGLQTIRGLYQHGFAVFRAVAVAEMTERIADASDLAAISSAADDYMFAYIRSVTDRVSSEWSVHAAGWDPATDGAVLSDPRNVEAARRVKETALSQGRWLAESPEESHARQATEQTLEEFVATFEAGVRDFSLSDRLKLADTTVCITLSDEPDLSITLLLDRSPVEILEGAHESECTMRIASVDLMRLWSPDFYLAMAITRGRVQVHGPVRRFLRVIPVLRVLSQTHRQLYGSPRGEEVA